MGRIEKSILKKKMKISALLIAATNAVPSSIHQWMVDNWWASAVETFNFASNNWDQFQGAVDSVDQSIFPPLFDWCNSNGDSEVSSEELIIARRKEPITSICQMITKISFINSPKNTGIWLIKITLDHCTMMNINTPSLVLLLLMLPLFSRHSMLTQMESSTVPNLPPGEKLLHKCSLNGIGNHLTNSSVEQNRHGLILKWMGMITPLLKQNLLNLA